MTEEVNAESLSIVIPAKNEAQSIAAVVRRSVAGIPRRPASLMTFSVEVAYDAATSYGTADRRAIDQPGEASATAPVPRCSCP